MWAYLAILVVSSVIVAALTPRPPAPKPAALEDFDLPIAEDGAPMPVVFGEVTLRGPNVLWYGDLVVHPIKKKGGKK